VTLSIDLTPDQEARLQAEATAHGMALTEFARLRLLESARKPTMTPREILAYWAEDDSPSVYGRTGEDAATIARRLRLEAERRTQIGSGAKA
jgi:hypothetical protein